MYDKYVSINKKFKSSVNLQYDLDNADKIKQYIPTSDLCDVIKNYLKSSLNAEGIKSTLLAGPYGKGKSYLILIILYLLSKKREKTVIEDLIDKIRPIDSELVDVIYEIVKSKIYYLPVIINNNESDDLTQNFMIGLRTALCNEGIEDLIPQSAFSECIAQLIAWENSEDIELVKLCEKTVKCSVKKLKVALSNFDKKAYDKFLNLFECVNHGYKFNPLYGSDFASIYDSVAKALKHYGYKGIFVVFDEFGVFLENKTLDFNVKLNKIQAFAEKCNSSDEEGFMQFCCVTHKDISLYQKDKAFSDDFEKISGRFKQIRFDRSLDENYQILCSAIGKGANYSKLVKQAINANKPFIEKLYESGMMSRTQVDYILNNGYPINPISLYVLIQISEKIAQNERTLFTFISDYDLFSFRYFITNNDSGLLNVDYIFDYFKNLIKDNDDYRAIYYKVDALSKVDLKKEDHRIFKAIALCKIVNDEIKFNSTSANIALSLDETKQNVELIIEELIHKGILKRSITDGAIDFDVMADAELNKLLESTIATKLFNQSNSDLLNQFSQNQYFISNRYNFEKKMVRYFSALYLDTIQFKQLASFDSLFNNCAGDGLVVNLINIDKSSEDEIVDILKERKASRIVVRFSKEAIDSEAFGKLKRIFAAKILLENKKELSSVLQESLNILIADTTKEINLYLEKYFQGCISLTSCDFTLKSLKDCIYASLSSTYNKTFEFNNEQVNKNEISTMTTKSRNIIIDDILFDRGADFGKTSAEATIQASFLQSIENNEELIEFLKEQFIKSRDNIKASYIVDLLTDAPYGMRKGVIPLVLAEVIHRLSIVSSNSIETVLFYNDSIEIELNAANLTKMMSNPSRYSFVYKTLNRERMELVWALASLFGVKKSKNFNDDLNNVFKSLKSYVANLEPVIVKATITDNVLGLSDQELNFKDLFMSYNLNIFNTLFELLPIRLGVNFKAVAGTVAEIKSDFFNKIQSLYNEEILYVSSIFGTSDESIKSNYALWKLQHKYVDNIIFDDQNKKIFNALELPLYSDQDMLNALSEAIVGCVLESWNLSKKAHFESALKSFVEFVNGYSLNGKIHKKELEDIQDKIALSKLGNTLYSNLYEVIEEYGDSLSNEEKVIILKKLLQDIVF